MKFDIDKYLLAVNSKGRQALMKINEIAIANVAIFIIDENKKLLGSITDGDIRRGLLQGKNIDDGVSEFMNMNSKFLIEDADNYLRVKEYKSMGVRFIPVVDLDKIIITLFDLEKIKSILPLDAIIMAGGRGERLKPLTDNVPKPMLKIGDKPIIIRNLERLISFGIKNFHVTVRYLGDKIISGIEETKNENCNYSYVKEDKPLGTIGAVKLVESIKNNSILLMNSDLLTNINFEEFYDFFIASNSDMVVATIPYHIDVPYAVMDINEKQEVQSFKEKPRYTYFSNAGIYLFKKDLLDLIPSNESFDATHFMEAVISKKLKLSSYPILDYWLDIGRIEDFHKAQEDVKHIMF